MKKMLHLSCLLTLLIACSYQIQAQISPTLSVQGILKKSNGVAVEDGNYGIVFKLYTAETGGTAIWTETQSNVEVSSGIYSAVLGVVNPLTVPFDQLYYLGITVGSSELTPRILLTSAPYALSLIGQTNKFPSSGKVQADSIQVNGGVLARGGAPGLNGANRNGYAFSGNSGDKDSGVFSTGDGKVSLYSNNVEQVTVNPTNVQVNTNLTVGGNLNTNGVAISNNGSISYNGENDWRLVETDYLDNDAEGWEVYDKLSGYSMGWNNPSSLGAAPLVNMGSFIGNVMLPTSNDHVLKKQFSIPGNFTQIKVKFRYYYIDTWGFGGGDRAWAAFASNASGSVVRVGWTQMPAFINDSNGDFNAGATPFAQNGNFYGLPWNAASDSYADGEMTARSIGNSFWLFIGAAVDMDVTDERYAVGAIEVYVK
ncbi:MAG: hypothetical protein IPL65_16390 [Lewinellaceae bacterium]|nr:hypothetical protein [Lewinellaceae bacterium]